MSDEEQLVYAIDSEVCAGHGRCYALAPADFEPDDVGYGKVIGSSKPASERSSMEHIAGQCPEQAITLVPAGA